MEQIKPIENILSYRQFFRNIFLAIFFCFFTFENVFSQTEWECGTDANLSVISEPSRGLNCSNSGTDFMNKYRTPGYWTPNNSTPIKTILINYIICQDSSGGNAWQDTPAIRATINQMFDLVNQQYSNSQPKGYPSTCEPTVNYNPDTRIRFELNEVIFLQDNAFNALCAPGTAYVVDAYIRANYPNIKGAMNHIFTAGTCGPHLGYYSPYSGHSYVSSKMWHGSYMTHADYIRHLCHEYAHGLGSWHTYDFEDLQLSSFNFLDDVFGTCTEPSMSDSTAPCLLAIAPPPSGYVNAIKDCYFTPYTSGNPLMTGKVGDDMASAYISPKMQGRMHRVLSLYNNTWVLNGQAMHQYVKEKYSYAIPLEITSNETWDFAIKLYQDIVVKSGSTLTIQCEVKMPINGKIIVERGASLVIDGGVIDCGWDDAMWQGIEVWGNRNASQLTAGAQGKVIMKNNAIIENSIDGIVTIRKDSNGNLDWNYTGGIVQATNSEFLNCRNGATFLSYHNFHPTTENTMNNISFFKNCVFKTDAQLNDINRFPYAHVSMYDIVGLKISGCDFINTANDIANSGYRGRGILSYDTKFTVDDLCTSITLPCNTYKQNTFTDLDYGIYCSNANVFYAPYVNHAKFKGNRFDGIHLSGVYYATIQNCDFDVSSYFDYGGASGLYLDYCKYYTVQNNYFHTTESVGWVGIYVKDSKTGAHELYNNTFEGLHVGIEPLRDNSGISNFSDGLTMHCNVFTANLFDIAVTGYTNPALGKNSIASIQGLYIPASPNPLGLVRNTYSASCGSENQYFMYINEPKIVQHHANSEAYTRPTPQPSCSDNLVNVVNSGIGFNRSLHCPDLTHLNNTLLTAKIAQITGEINQLRQSYNNTIDEGNTNTLLNAIYSNMSPGSLKNLLISKSPYLSDAVLIAYLTKANTPPNGHVKEVIVANSPVTDAVKEKIDLLNLPPGIKNQINAAQTKNLSSRQFLEAQIVQLEYDKQLRVSDKIRYFLNDTLETNPLDSLIALIKQYPRSDNPCEIVSAYVTKGDYAKAQAVVDSLQAINQVDDFCAFQKILLQLNQSTEKCFKLQTDVVLKDKVEEIAADCTKDGCCNAQALLKQVFNYQYQELRMLPEENRSVLIETEQIPNVLENGLSIYPNPANDFVNIVFNDDEAESAVMEIKDVLGKTIETISLKVAESKMYDTQMLKGGVYFFTLYINNTIIENKKIVLVK